MVSSWVDVTIETMFERTLVRFLAQLFDDFKTRVEQVFDP